MPLIRKFRLKRPTFRFQNIINIFGKMVNTSEEKMTPQQLEALMKNLRSQPTNSKTAPTTTGASVLSVIICKRDLYAYRRGTHLAKLQTIVIKAAHRRQPPPTSSRTRATCISRQADMIKLLEATLLAYPKLLGNVLFLSHHHSLFRQVITTYHMIAKADDVCKQH